MYADMLSDRKVQDLPPALFKTWVNILCVAAKNDSAVLPSIQDLAFLLRLRQDRTQLAVSKLTQRGLLDDADGTLTVHNWDSRQYKRQSFQSQKNTQIQNQIQSTESDTESETESEKKEDSAQQASLDSGLSRASPVRLVTSQELKPKYFFEAGVIKLSKEDYENWKTSFDGLSLSAELIGLATWAGKQENWFCAVSGALAKKQREVTLELKKAVEQREEQRQIDWKNGKRPCTPFD